MPGQQYSSADQNQSLPDQGMCVDESSQDFGSNSDQGVQVRGSDLTDRSGEIREATRDLGEVDSLGGGFTRSAGGVLDAVLPNAGDKGKVQIAVNVPVDQTGTVTVGFNFIAEAERDDNGVKGRVQLGGAVTASREIPLLFTTAEIFARAEVYGYMESYGDSSQEMFELLLLAIQQRVAAQSQEVADAVFDARHIRDTMAAMDNDDYVESGLGGSVSVGASLSDGDETLAGAGAGIGASTGTRLTSNGRGGVRENDTSQIVGSLNCSVPPFGLEGKLTGKWLNGSLNKVEAEVSGQHDMDFQELNEVVVGGRWLSGATGTIAGLIQGQAGILDDANAARRVGGMVSTVRQLGASGALAEAASARAIDNLQSMGVTLAHKLTVKVTWDSATGFSAEFCLERVGSIEFGDNPRDTVYVLVENVQRVFQLQIGG